MVGDGFGSRLTGGCEVCVVVGREDYDEDGGGAVRSSSEARRWVEGVRGVSISFLFFFLRELSV